jgi:hypothetical protein
MRGAGNSHFLIKFSGKALVLVVALLVAIPASSQTVTIDPETGDFIDPPAAEQATRGQSTGGNSALAASALSTYHGDLVAVPSPTPGGGLMVDLRGRFQQVMKATIGPDGIPAVHCDPAAGEGN